ncbi:MAG TPA: KH domain-containing protein, partial [Nitrosopumilaceae archaeon]|nr:KH domain-containing protein [Nitrosopumilaceae archaeon]
AKSGGIEKLAESKIRETIRRFDPDAEIEILSNNSIQVRVDKEVMPSIIGRGGSTINELEKALGVHIDVEPKVHTFGNEIDFELSEAGNNIVLEVDETKVGMYADIYVKGQYLLSAHVGKKGRIKISKRSESGKKIINAVMAKQDIKLILHN